MRLATVFVVSAALVEAHPTFEEWATRWNIPQSNSADESMRRNYRRNCDEIDRLNEEHSGATFTVNKFSGMSYEEFSAKFLAEIPKPEDSDVPSLEIDGDYWCCQDSNCAVDSCFADDSFCTMSGRDKCIINCGGKWCPKPSPTPSPTPSPSPKPAGWCCSDAGCAVETCFPDDTFCTVNGPDTCVNNCGGTWCPEPAPAPPPADHISWPISGIREQSCGSCWDFATIAMIESAAIARGAPACIDLSEEQVLDCGGGTCAGGRSEAAFQTIIANQKIYTQESCPWTGRAATCDACDAEGVASGITITGYHRGTGTDATDALFKMLQNDPATVYLNADQTFMYGWTGILEKPSTGACAINHVVLMMGYDNRGAVPYWQIKNSWGPFWGENGTARFAQTSEACGPFDIMQDYHVVADGITIGELAPCPPPTPPPPPPPPTPPPAPTPPKPAGWCCRDAGCAVETCFADDSFCTMNGPDKCVNNCGGTWCPEPAPTPSPAPTPTTTTTTTLKPAGWCCQDAGCAVETCFADDMFCTMNGPDKCVNNCGGTWCPKPVVV